MRQARVDLDILLAKLRHAQADYDWARSRGDVERAAQVRIKLQGMIAERDRLTRLASNDLSPLEVRPA